MGRILTSNARAKIARRTGVQPINVVKVFWHDETSTNYADRSINGASGSILEIGSLDDVIKLASAGTSSSISIVLNDTDGSIKELLDTYDVHKRPCQIFQTFDDLGPDDWFLLFEGEISSPIIWSESNRTVSFDILSKIESNEVGFAPEEGQFPNIENSEPWPVCFGDVVHVPATKITSQLVSTTTSPFVIVDPSLPLKLAIMNRAIVAYSYSWSTITNTIKTINLNHRSPDALIPDYAASIVSEDTLKQIREDLAGSLEQLQKAADGLRQSLEESDDDSDSQDIQNQLTSVKAEIEQIQGQFTDATSNLVDVLWGKKLLEIELDVLEFKFNYIGALIERLGSILGNLSKAVDESGTIQRVITTQKAALVNEVAVVNGNKFPQGITVDVLLNGLRVEGHFEDKIFKVHRPKATYSNLITVPDPNDNTAFTVSESTINLKGMYCRLEDNRIFRVRDQIGTKCFLDPIVSKRNLYNMRRFNNPNDYHQELLHLVDSMSVDLASSTYDLLAGATEFTINEKERKIVDSLNKSYYGPQLEVLKEKIKFLVDSLGEAPDLDTYRSLEKGVSSNLSYLHSLLNEFVPPADVNAELNRLLSDDEYKNLKRMEILYQAEVIRNATPVLPITTHDLDLYFLDSTAVTKIIEAAPVVLPEWINPYFSKVESFFSLTQTDNDGIFHLPTMDAWIASANSEIKLFADNQEKYVASIIPGSVHSVYAKRNVNGLQHLVPVPTSYYTVNETESFGTVTREDDTIYTLECVTITLKKPLSEYNEGWLSDDLFVSLSSTIGPNTADILKWLIENYTSSTVDLTSYNDVKSKLTNFPSSFALFNKEQVLSVIDQIAWQARCAITFRENVAYFLYLPSTPQPIKEITEKDIEQGTFQITYTETEDLVTKFVAKWKRDYFETKPIKTIVRHNILKYGVHQTEYDFFIYNDVNSVSYAATFWSMRLSNTWKKVTFDGFLTLLDLQTMDAVVLNINPNFYSNQPVIGIVEKAEYDSSSNTVKVEVWLPVRCGEMSPYLFAWPSDLPVETIYPTVEEIAAGDAGNPFTLDVGQDIKYTIDSTNSFFNTVTGQEPRPKDFGIIQLSDLAAPTPSSPLAELLNIELPTVDVSDYYTDVSDVVFDKNQDTSKTGFLSTAEKKVRAVDIDIEKLQSPGDSSNITLFGRVTSKTADGDYTVSVPDGRILTAKQTSGVDANHKEGTIVALVANPETQDYEISSVSTTTDSSLKRVKVTGISGDYLTCKLGDTTIKVLKPYTLRKTPFDGKTINSITYTYTSNGRNVTQGEFTEFQRIIPAYGVNDFIYIVSITSESVNGTSFRYLDVNTDARSWASSTT